MKGDQSLLIRGEPGGKGIYKNTTLVFLAFSTAFYSRVFCAITRAPSALSHFHFLAIFSVLTVTATTTRTRDRKQIAISWSFIYGLLVLLGTMFASALLNDAGLINAIFSFLMLGEPFMLMLAIICIPMSAASVEQFRKWIVVSSFINLVLAFIQYPLLASGKISAGGLDATDGTAGVFFVSGAGNYVSSTVSLYFGLYYLMSARSAPNWLRVGTILAALVQMQLTDAKQVLLVLFAAWAILTLTNVKDIRKSLLYTIAIVGFAYGFYWCIENVQLDFFAAFKNYVDKQDAYGPDGEAFRIKPIAFRIIPTFYHSLLNWLLGLGPGHTVGRLGGWLLKENWAIFGALGATRHPASDAVIYEYFNSWLALESTIFCPMFGWAGIWGDLGLAGLGAYLFLGFLTWKHLCIDDFSKFLLISAAIFGLIFTQMEEPGYMLYTTSLIALRWQEHRMTDRETA